MLSVLVNSLFTQANVLAGLGEFITSHFRLGKGTLGPYFS